MARRTSSQSSTSAGHDVRANLFFSFLLHYKMPEASLYTGLLQSNGVCSPHHDIHNEAPCTPQGHRDDQFGFKH